MELRLHTVNFLASRYVGKQRRTNNEPQNRINNVCVEKMKKSLSSIEPWAADSNLLLNETKTKQMVITTK